MTVARFVGLFNCLVTNHQLYDMLNCGDARSETLGNPQLFFARLIVPLGILAKEPGNYLHYASPDIVNELPSLIRVLFKAANSARQYIPALSVRTRPGDVEVHQRPPSRWPSTSSIRWRHNGRAECCPCWDS
jgi:hypothetical protein